MKKLALVLFGISFALSLNAQRTIDDVDFETRFYLESNHDSLDAVLFEYPLNDISFEASNDRLHFKIIDSLGVDSLDAKIIGVDKIRRGVVKYDVVLDNGNKFSYVVFSRRKSVTGIVEYFSYNGMNYKDAVFYKVVLKK